MKYALLTALILALLLWVDLHSPLTGLTPAVKDTDRAIERLQEQLAHRDWPGARETLATIKDGARRTDVLLSLLADVDSHHRFLQLLDRIEAGLASRDPDASAADAAELRRVWRQLLSP